jgi:hypothetical protein
MNTENILSDSESWKRALASGDIAAAASPARRANLQTDMAFILAAAGSGGCRTLSKVDMLEKKYGWTGLAANSQFFADTRDLPSFDPGIPQAGFFYCGLDVGLFEAWQSHPAFFKDKQGAIHGPAWIPDADTSGVRLVSAVGNVVGYQAADLLEDEFRWRGAHLLANGRSGQQDLALVTVEFPGGTGTGVTPHMRVAARRAFADDQSVTLHPIRFLVLPTDTAEEAVKLNAEEMIIELALDGVQPDARRSSGVVFCVSPSAPTRLLDAAQLEDRAAYLMWTVASAQTGILPALLAEMANVEAASTKDQRGLLRNLSFAGASAIDGGLFEWAQQLTLELIVDTATHVYGRTPLDPEDPGPLNLPALASGRASGGQLTPAASSGGTPQSAPVAQGERPRTKSSNSRRPPALTRVGERARRIARELISFR